MNYLNAKTTVKINTEAKNLTFLIREKVEGEKFDAEKHDTYVDITFYVSELPAEIREYAVLHGLKQKLADALAFTKEDKATKTTADAEKALEALWEQLKGGDWNAKSKGRKPAEPSVKLSDMEEKLLARVKAGLMSWDEAYDFYRDLAGKELPKLQDATDETDETEQDIN